MNRTTANKTFSRNSFFDVKKRGWLYVLLFFFYLPTWGQSISGRVVNEEEEAVGGASVILQTPDSIFVESGITDEQGRFSLKHTLAPYRLLIQHLVYHDQIVHLDKNSGAIHVQMKEKNYELKGVDVLAKPPLVHLAANGAFLYNVSRLREISAASNAYELLADIPGVLKNEESYNIVGVGNTAILLNGHKSNMSASDLTGLLQMTSLEDLKDIEVYYNTPPHMGVNGASININLRKKRSEHTRLSGELHTTAFVGRKYYEVGGMHLGISGKRCSFDFGYGLGSLNKVSYASSFYNHTVNDILHSIESSSRIRQDLFSHRINGRFSFDFRNKAQFTASYDVKFTDRSILTSIPMTDKGRSHTDSEGRIDGNDAMHVATVEYVHKAWTAGGDFVFYNYSTGQNLTTNEDGKTKDLTSDNRQKVRHGSLYANHHGTFYGGTLNYGGNVSRSSSDNSFWNQWSERNRENSASKQKEVSAEAFLSWNRQCSHRFTLTAGLKAQYFHADLTRKEEKSTLWNGIYFYPSFNLQYKVTDRRSLFLSLATDRTYPSYYATSESRRYHNTYRVDISNPSLKPYTTYETHLNYVWKGTNVLGLYALMRPDMVQMYSYQHPDELIVDNGRYNCSRHNTLGFMSALPHEWNQYIQSQLTTDIYYREVRGSYADNAVSFSSHDFSGVFSLMNTVRLLNNKSLLLQLGASYHLPSDERVIRYSHQWNTTAAMLWHSLKGNWHLTLKANDLLNTCTNKATTIYGNQYIIDRSSGDVRAINLNVRYVFNAFKQKKVRQVDTTRMTALVDNINHK